MWTHQQGKASWFEVIYSACACEIYLSKVLLSACHSLGSEDFLMSPVT